MMDRISEVIEDAHGIPRGSIKSPCREKEIAISRLQFVLIAWESGYTLQQIASHINRSYDGVRQAYNKGRGVKRVDVHFRGQITLIQKLLQ